MSSRPGRIAVSTLAAICAAIVAWRYSDHAAIVFSGGYLCALWTEMAYRAAFPKGIHIRLWPRP